MTDAKKKSAPIGEVTGPFVQETVDGDHTWYEFAEECYAERWEACRAAVLDMWPTAYPVRCWIGCWHILRNLADRDGLSKKENNGTIASEADAWIDAYERLRADHTETRHEFMPFRNGVCEKCGRERNDYQYHLESCADQVARLEARVKELERENVLIKMNALIVWNHNKELIDKLECALKDIRS